MELPFSNQPSSSRMVGPYGTNHLRACAGCSRAKVKCIPSQDGSGECQRCQRLHQPCESSTPKVRSPTRKRKPKEPKVTSFNPQANVERLEQKLDGVVSLIESIHEVASNQRKLSSALDYITASSTASQPPRVMNQSASESPHGSHDQISQTTDPSTSSICPPSHAPAGQSSLSETQNSDSILSSVYMPNFAEANAHLDIFKGQMSPHFPFIVIPQSMSAEELYHDKPFLYISILAIASRDSVQQKGLGRLFIKQFAERMFVNCERNLDLLLGILTYAGWCYNHFWNIPQFTSLLCAAMTLVCDLGLSQPLVKKLARKSPFDDALRATCPQSATPPTKVTRTLEELRAFLGCFFLSSVASLSFRRIDSHLKHSPHIDDCVRHIEEFGDHPNDKSTVAIVKLQIIAERIYQSPWHNNAELHGIDTCTMFIVNTLQQELKRFAESLLLEQANNPMILMHYHVAEVALYEAGTRRSHLATDPVPNFKRLELLSSCLQASKSYFDTFFSIPVADYVGLSIPTWSHLTRSIAILHNLSSFEYPGWSLGYVRETIDFVTVLDQVSGRLDSVNTLAGYKNLDTFSPTAKRMNRVKLYVEGKLDSEPAGNMGPEPDTILDCGTIPRTEEFSNFFQYLDDDWMGDILEPPEYGLRI